MPDTIVAVQHCVICEAVCTRWERNLCASCRVDVGLPLGPVR